MLFLIEKAFAVKYYDNHAIHTQLSIFYSSFLQSSKYNQYKEI